jgi:hypothetical protein
LIPRLRIPIILIGVLNYMVSHQLVVILREAAVVPQANRTKGLAIKIPKMDLSVELPQGILD